MENKTEIKTYLPIFKGFYGSYWEDYLKADGEAEHYNLPEEFDFFNYLDYDKYHEELVKQFCQIAEKHLYQFVDKIIFEKLVSPKYYNFTNDSINCTIIPKLDIVKGYIYEHKEAYSKYLKDNYSSRDGFISYHANDFENWEALTENFTDLTGSHTLGSILNFIAQNEEITEEIFYYDVEDVHIGNFYTDEFYEIIKNNKPMKRQDKILKQIALQNLIISKANVNLVNCGSCGSVLFHSTKDEEIECPFCDFKSDPCDFPDYFYTGMELGAEFDED